MNLGENIKKARKAAGVTQKELAERLQERYKPLGKQRAYAKRNNTCENLQRA